MDDTAPLLVGVDGGATEVKAHAVACADPRRVCAFSLRPESAARVYPAVAGFTPVPVAEQLAQRDAGNVRLTQTEIEQGRLWIAAAADAIAEVATQAGRRRLQVGIGMPGLKTLDGRGINVINNGPRIPNYLDQLEQQLRAAGLELSAPIAALGSDADYCGLGEECAADGLFRDVENAYYVGCGTGVADALKLRGRLVPFDRARTWILKSWQITAAAGPTFEKLISAKAVNQAYADLKRRTGNVEADDFPEQAALRGDPLARDCLDAAAATLAELIFERLWTIKNSRAVVPHRGLAYVGLEANHEFRGTLLERVIIGQRLGAIYATAEYRNVFAEKVDTYLAACIAAGGDQDLITAYLQTASPKLRHVAILKPCFLRGSRLRAAPALGAAAAALQSAREKTK